MCEDGSPHRGSGSEYGDKAARDELLRPEDDRPAPAEIDEADNDRDTDRSPAARERLPQRDGHEREERGDRDRAHKSEYERGHVVHPDLYRAPRGAPDERNGHVSGGDAERRHARAMMAHIVMSMRRVVPFAWLIAVVIAGCAPATLAGTDLGATDAPDFTLTDGLSGRALTLSAQRGQVVALGLLSSECTGLL